MTSLTRSVWKELRQRAGPSDAMPTVQRDAFCRTHGYSECEADAAIEDLILGGAISRLDDNDLQRIASHKALPGDFIIWVTSSSVSVFYRIKSPAEVQRAAAAKRELLRRELARYESDLRAVDRESEIALAVAASHSPAGVPPSAIEFSRKYLDLYFSHRWHEALNLAAAGTVTPEQVRAAWAQIEADPSRWFSMHALLLARFDEARRSGRDSLQVWLIVWLLSQIASRPAVSDRVKATAAARARVAVLEADAARLTALMETLEVDVKETSNQSRDTIPKAVQQEVWRRDQGRCIQCGSQERLHFDHVIPVSRGGGRTARNVQLLCERCNLAKSDTI